MLSLGIWSCTAAALVLRLGLIIYGEWQDRNMLVKYTDVDYHVFTDAAEFVLKGESPYQRTTYRYTPLVAWMLLPNHLLTVAFGKIIFCVFDVLTGALIYTILRKREINQSKSLICSCLWLFNLLPVTVSSRGNAESIMSLLVLSTLWCVANKRTMTAGIIYALSVHFKIYPVTYSMPLYFFMDSDYVGSSDRFKSGKIQYILHLFMPNWERFKFVLSTLTSLFVLTMFFYWWYGWDFLEHSYLYHITRTDTRHNFSVYFYMLYLTAEQGQTTLISLAVFLPQFVLLLVFSFYFYKDPAFCCLLQTIAFVTFNKVCTSQYFLWYLCLLPLVVPSLSMSVIEGLALLSIWFIGQALWLYPAYLLEFKGQNTFIWIWLAGLLFFIINVFITCRFIRTYIGSPWFHQGRLTKHKEKAA